VSPHFAAVKKRVPCGTGSEFASLNATLAQFFSKIKNAESVALMGVIPGTEKFSSAVNG
jgi:hypothetical protein